MGLAEIVLVIISTLLGLAVLVGGFAAFRIGRSNALVSGYKEAAESWETQSRAHKSALEEAEDKILTMQRQISEMQGKITVLEDLATGKTAIDELRAEIAGNTRILKEIRDKR